MSPTVAFAPGRANLIGEHTDYNDGLSLPFAVEQGVTASLTPSPETRLNIDAGDRGVAGIVFGSSPESRLGDWRDYIRGAAGELAAAGVPVCGGRLEIASTVPAGGGLSSAAALTVAVTLALLAAAGRREPDRVWLAQLCSRVENAWVGAPTGLLDQLASLLGRAGHAVRIDFRTLETEPVALELGEWRLIAVDSGEAHVLSESGYGERRRECEEARERLGLVSLRDARMEMIAALPDAQGRRVRHVIGENARVERTVHALARGELALVGELLDASHASLRDLYDSSTAAVEATVARLKRSGAAGARMMGGGFGGSVLALLPPGMAVPDDAAELRPAQGARLLEE